MDFQSPPDTRFFRSQPTKMDSTNVDAENGIIYDVVMASEGEAKGHGVHLDGDFISNLVAYDNRYFKKIGLKARFGHPGASSETMGTQLGIFQDFRKREKNGKMEAIANLHLMDAAEISPTHPGMKSWVLKMAQERPDFIMSSIVFRPSGYFQNINGKKLKVWTSDENGEWVSPVSKEPVYVEFDEKNGAEHFYTDLVEQGAATDTLYSTTANPHLFVAQVDQFLDDNPNIKKFVKDNPDAVAKWLARAGYVAPTTVKKGMDFSIKNWLLGKDQDAEPDTKTLLNELRDGLTEARKALTDSAQPIVELGNQLKALADANTALKTELDTLKTELAALTTKVEALAAQPLGTPTGADTPPAGKAGDEKVPAYKQTALYKRMHATK